MDDGSEGNGPKDDGPNTAALEEVAARHGFTARQAGDASPRVDGRSLRRTGRSKALNIRVKPQTHTRFWLLAERLGKTGGEELLLHLMELAERD